MDQNKSALLILVLWVASLGAAAPAGAQSAAKPVGGAGGARRSTAPTEGVVGSYVPPAASLVGRRSSELRDFVERYSTDRAGVLRRYDAQHGSGRRAALEAFSTAWLARLAEVDFEPLGPEGRLDAVLLRNHLRYELDLLAREERLLTEAAPLVPFENAVLELQESRRRMEPVDPSTAARALAHLAEEVENTRKAMEAGLRPDAGKDALKTTRIVAYRASELLADLRKNLERWYQYYAGYDPLFTWWVGAPYKKADEALKAYVGAVREKAVGIKEGEDEPIVGDPVGTDGLRADLAHEMIPYAPDELIAIAEKEFAWCEAEARRAARDMGLGDDWKAAVERVKTLHVDPGRQPDLIRDQAREAIAFVEKHDLVTVPPLAKDMWRIEMMSPERQKVNPFFLGGEVIQVSFPTDAMAHEDKLMSMRGNNVHFSRATVHHELIPGHHLQGFMLERYNPHRSLFDTPFWIEGWSLYWEMQLYDLGFPETPENRVGMLFWRMHRAARILFSLNFHLGNWTPQQCIDFLVERVGHERANATAEVRRSFNGSYSPLYQLAYMIGGLQFRALHKELVGSGKMTNRDFHDAILQGGTMPVEMVRARLINEPLTRDRETRWKFAGDNPRAR